MDKFTKEESDKLNFDNLVFGRGEDLYDTDDDSDSDDEEIDGQVYEDDDDLEYEPSLKEVVEEIDEMKLRIQELGEMLVAPTIKVVYEVKSQIANIFGILEDLQYEIDSLSLEDADERVQRKQTVKDLDALFTNIADLSDRCLVVIRVKADEERKKGNQSFKDGDYEHAIAHYSMAVSIDPKNATLYTNRALAYQKAERYDLAIKDAKDATKIDVNFLKGYIILIKCQSASDMIVAAAETIASVPLALHDRQELVELKQTTGQLAKDAGNAHLRAQRIDDAVGMYTVAITCDPDNHLLYSNRSAAYQSKKSWQLALTDADRCLKRCNTFPKGFVHMGRCQVQLKRFDDAERTVSLAENMLEEDALATIRAQLQEISSSVRKTKQASATREAVGPSAALKATQFKEKGNMYYKKEEYQEAIRYYTQALSLQPQEGSYYGNRAAAWLMMKEYTRAVKDCVDGIKHEDEDQRGQLDKLRQRHATALAASGQVRNSVKVLQEALELEDRVVFTSVKAIEAQMEKVQQAENYAELAQEALENRQFTRARRLFQNAQVGGLTDAPTVLLGIAKTSLGLHEYEDASREAQKVIEADKNMLEGYVVRADALLANGCTDLAERHYKAALQQDPDNSGIAKKLKALRRMVADLTRVRGLIDNAMNERDFEQAIQHCGEGLSIDKESKKIMGEMHERRAKCHSMLASQHLRGHHPSSVEGAEGEEASQSQATASWRKCMSEANSALYYDNSVTGIPALFLKCQALQALDHYEEALEELTACLKGVGEDDPTVKSKFKEAKQLLKKSKRVDLYKIMGVSKGEHASEAEIKKAYKKAALKWHPDRHSRKGEEQKKEAEHKFKEIGDAFGVLTDPDRKKMYDQGFDREEIEQKMEEKKQQEEYGRGGGRGHHHGGHGHGFGGGW